ncbi:MAG: ABC transporter ATP-binding protein [Thermoleophilia bacterium]|nr:ABC transporter ATP-binding protein [Thermoleophilia bacterium]
MAPGEQGAAVIQVTSVTKSYGSGRGRVEALRGVDLTVHEGETVAIVGQSGSGKTTLLQMLGAVDVPTSGTVEVAGRDLGSMRERDLTGFRRSVVGFVFQQFNLIPTLTAYQNVEAAAVNVPGEGADRIAGLLEQVGLGDRMDHRPAELSGGEQQRVAIARALVNDPTIILADEPTGNLDSETGHEVLELLTAVAVTGRRTLVLITHDDRVAAAAERIITIRDGLIVDG